MLNLSIIVSRVRRLVNSITMIVIKQNDLIRLVP